MPTPEQLQEVNDILRSYIPLIQYYQRVAHKIKANNGLSFLLADLMAYLKKPEWTAAVKLDLRITDELNDLRFAMDDWIEDQRS